MSERERKIDLSGAQIVAGVLATLTAAIASSFLGVQADTDRRGRSERRQHRR